jgi:Phenylalanyl-tRNA synthetase alpha subunit
VLLWEWVGDAHEPMWSHSIFAAAPRAKHKRGAATPATSLDQWGNDVPQTPGYVAMRDPSAVWQVDRRQVDCSAAVSCACNGTVAAASVSCRTSRAWDFRQGTIGQWWKKRRIRFHCSWPPFWPPTFRALWERVRVRCELPRTLTTPTQTRQLQRRPRKPLRAFAWTRRNTQYLELHLEACRCMRPAEVFNTDKRDEKFFPFSLGSSSRPHTTVAGVLPPVR